MEFRDLECQLETLAISMEIFLKILENLLQSQQLADEEVLNYLTAEGCRVLGVEVKKKRVPKVGRFEHDKGVIDSYIWLCLKGLLCGYVS